MPRSDSSICTPVARPRIFRLPRLRISVTFSHLWRLVMVSLMVSLYVITCWSGLSTPAYAATLSHTASTRSQSPITLNHPLSKRPTTHHPAPTPTSTPASRRPPGQKGLAPQVSSSQPFDGLGDLPFYTYVTLRIDDRVELKVNVANGNLLVHTTDLHIRGTGIDESLEGYYNSLGYGYSYDHGSGWTFNFSHDVFLDLVNPPGITLNGPSGYHAFFAYNSSTGTYTDPPGLNVTLVHNTDGSYTLTFHRTGEQLIFSGTSGFLSADKDKNGNTISYSANLSSLTDTQGRVANFTYNPAGQISGLTDPSGRTVQYGYSASCCYFTSLTDASGKVTTFNNSNGLLTSITDPLNNTTHISYSAPGATVNTITDATTHGTISFTYNSGNTVVTDRNGNATTYTYNSALQVTKTTDALGHSSTNTFDALNYNMTQYGDALGDLSNFSFAAGTNNLTSAADGNGASSSFGYPSPGSANQYYPLNQTDPQSNVTDYAYDSNGNLLSATNHASGKGLTYTYNSNGTVATETDADGNKTSFGYDAKGNLTSVTPPSPLGGTTLTVDAPTSRVTSVTDGNGKLTSYSYDNLDRVIKITYNGGATISYTYDDDGNLLSLVDNTGTTSFTYDVLNRIKTKTLPDGVVFTTNYDKNGNLTSFADGGGTVSYQYDAANRMTTLTDTDSSQTIYTYDAANRKTMIQYPNGTGMRMTYDKAGHELTSIGGAMDIHGTLTTTYSSFSYNYKAGSTQTALLQAVTLLDPTNWQSGTTYKRQYSYNKLNGLMNAAVFNSNNVKVEDYSYTYDAAGNRLTSSVLSTGISDSYTYNAANELTTRTEGSTTTTYSYDGNGNLTGSTGGPSLAYNSKNQTKNIGSDTYAYSGPDQRDRVTVNTTTFDYSGLGLSRQTDSTGTTHYARCSCGLLNNERTPMGTGITTSSMAWAPSSE